MKILGKLRKRFLIPLIVVLFVFGVLQINLNMQLPLSNVVQIKVISTEIDWYTGEPAEWQGSGIFIKDNLILTAGHIVDTAARLTIITVNGEVYTTWEWYKEADADIGLIEVDTCKKEKKLKFDNAILGETVWAYGNPYGVFPVLTKGIISAIDMYDNYTNTKNMIITDAGANAGNSGCALFDKYGNILGICSWHYSYPATEGMNYFVRAEVIKLSLEKYYAIKALEEIE